MVQKLCEACGSEGKIYTSRYGGNDPDVWPLCDCSACEGKGVIELNTDECLLEIIGHLGAAITQSLPEDDQIIMRHVQSAHDFAVSLRHSLLEQSKQQPRVAEDFIEENIAF